MGVWERGEVGTGLLLRGCAWVGVRLDESVKSDIYIVLFQS